MDNQGTGEPLRSPRLPYEMASIQRSDRSAPSIRLEDRSVSSVLTFAEPAKLSGASTINRNYCSVHTGPDDRVRDGCRGGGPTYVGMSCRCRSVAGSCSKVWTRPGLGWTVGDNGLIRLAAASAGRNASQSWIDHPVRSIRSAGLQITVNIVRTCASAHFVSLTRIQRIERSLVCWGGKRKRSKPKSFGRSRCLASAVQSEQNIAISLVGAGNSHELRPPIRAARLAAARGGSARIWQRKSVSVDISRLKEAREAAGVGSFDAQ